MSVYATGFDQQGFEPVSTISTVEVADGHGGVETYSVETLLLLGYEEAEIANRKTVLVIDWQ